MNESLGRKLSVEGKSIKIEESILTKPLVSKLCAILCALLWSSCFPFVKLSYTLLDAAPSDIGVTCILAGTRFFVGSTLAYLLLSLKQRKAIRPEKREIKHIVVVALVMTVIQSVSFYVGVSHTEASKASVLNAFGSFLTVIIAHFVFRNDRLNGRKIVGCVAGLAGIAVINSSDGSLAGGFSLLGDGGVLLAATCFAVGSTYSKVCSGKIDPLRLAVFQMLLGSVMLIVIGLILGGSVGFGSIPGILLTLYMGIATITANCLWMKLLQYNKISSISVFNFLIPIFGAVLSALILQEDIFKLSGLIGMLLACGGIFIVNYRRE